MRFAERRRVLDWAVAAIIVVTPFAAAAEPDVLDWLAKDPGSEAARRAVRNSIDVTSNRTYRAKLAVAYCLACRYAGEWEEATRTRLYLDRDHSRSPYLRYLDPSRTEDVCPHCLGVKSAEYTCKKCRGNGDCTSCKGTGQKTIAGFDGKAPGPCGVCHGSGECKVCRGAGKHPSVCKVCAGEGTRNSKSKLHAALQALVHGVEAPVGPATQSAANPIVAVLAHLDALPEIYRAADTTLKKETVFKAHVAPLPGMFKGQTMTLTSKIKDVTGSGGGRVHVATTGFQELAEIKSPDSGIGLHKGSALHILMSRDEAARFSPGQEIVVTGRLEYRPGYRSDVAVNYARDLPVLHIRFIQGSDRKDVGQVLMTDYTCNIGDKRYRSPFR